MTDEISSLMYALALHLLLSRLTIKLEQGHLKVVFTI